MRGPVLFGLCDRGFIVGLRDVEREGEAMRRDDNTRYGCDRCKLNNGTYVFRHDELKIWLCDHCLAVLLDWPKDKRKA